MRIKELLEEKGVTAKWLATNTGLTEMGLSKIVTGKSSPNADTITKIAKALNVTCGALFDDFVHEKPSSTPSLTCPKCGEVIHIKTEIV